MEEEIDLRPYIRTLIRGWYWVVGTAIVAAAVSLGVTFLLPPAYAATSLVAVISPSEVIELDASIAELVQQQPLAAFPELAESDEVLLNVMAKIEFAEKPSLVQFRQSLAARAGTDDSLIRLIANSDSPAKASEIANVWAEEFVLWANSVYGDQNEEKVQFFERQLAAAETNLAAAEQALEAYQAINQTEIISRTLSFSQEQRVELLADQVIVQKLMDNAVAFRGQLAAKPSQQTLPYVDQVTYLQLQLQTYEAGETLPFLLQLGNEQSLTNVTVSEQLNVIDDLMVALDARQGLIEQQLAELDPAILALQQEGQAAFTELNRLQRNVNIAQQTVTSLAFQVNEVQISSQDTTQGFRLASGAAVPERPLGPRKLIVIAVSGTLGALLGAFVLFAREWWRRSELSFQRKQLEDV